MRRLMCRFLHALAGEDGGVLVLVALSSAALLAFSALAIDIGMLMTAHSEAQRAADSAALAGASAYLDFDPATKPVSAQQEGEKRVMSYASQNAIRGTQIDTATEVQAAFMLSAYKVRVTVTRKALPLWFARIFGLQTWTVSASATAEATYAGSADCIKPFMIPDMWEEQGVAAGGVGDDTVVANGVWDFDEAINCHGQCSPEVWHFDPGDVYTAPVVSGGQITVPGTGYGSGTRDGAVLDTIRTWDPQCASDPGCIPANSANQPQQYTKGFSGIKYQGDDGRRIPLKIQQATGGNVQSFWYPWDIPGSSNSGEAAVVANITKCVPLTQLNIGQMVNIDGSAQQADSLNAQTQNGLAPTPIYNAIKDLVNQDSTLYWDENLGHPRYPGAPASDVSWEASPRVFTVVIFDPTGMRQGQQSYPIVNFGRFFLEDPDKLYPDVAQKQKRPITGRLIKFAKGQAGPTQSTLVRTLRLVE